MTLIEDTTEMASNKVIVESLESLDIFQLNPYNVRNWDSYSLHAEIQDNKLVFISDSKNAPKDLQEFIDSLLIYSDSEETVNGIVTINLEETLLVTPKINGVKDGSYILLSGNSRVLLTRNMIQAYDRDISESDQALYQLQVKPIRYAIKSDYKKTDLLVLQYTANTTIPLTGLQKLELIGRRIDELVENDPDLYAGTTKANTGRLASTICKEFSISLETYSKAKKLKKLDPFLQEKLEAGLFKNPDVALNIQKLLDNKQYGSSLKPATLWNAILKERGSDEYVTDKHVKAVQKEIEAEFGTIEEEEIDPDSVDYEESGSVESEEPSKSETKLKEIERLRGLERSQLNDEAVTALSELVDVLTEVDPTQYDTEDAIKLLLSAKENIVRIQKMKTTAKKLLEKAEKEAQKEAEKAAKATAETTAETPEF